MPLIDVTYLHEEASNDIEQAVLQSFIPVDPVTMQKTAWRISANKLYAGALRNQQPSLHGASEADTALCAMWAGAKETSSSTHDAKGERKGGGEEGTGHEVPTSQFDHETGGCGTPGHRS